MPTVERNQFSEGPLLKSRRIASSPIFRRIWTKIVVHIRVWEFAIKIFNSTSDCVRLCMGERIEMSSPDKKQGAKTVT